jgi:hypothetical protein
MTEQQVRDDDGLRTIRHLRLLILFMIYGVFIFVTIPIAIYTLPDLEAAWYPPIKDQEIANKHLKPDDPGFMLEEWSFVKQRRAEPEFITFMAYLPDVPQERYAVDAYIGWDCKQNFRSDRTSQPSPNRVTRKICIRLPDKLRGRADTVIEGLFDFRVGHRLYTVPVKVPAVTEPRSIPAPLASPK